MPIVILLNNGLQLVNESQWEACMKSMRDMYEVNERHVWSQWEACMKPMRGMYEANERHVWSQWEACMKPMRGMYEANERHVWSQWEACMKPMRGMYEANERHVWSQWEACMKPMRGMYEANERHVWSQWEACMKSAEQVRSGKSTAAGRLVSAVTCTSGVSIIHNSIMNWSHTNNSFTHTHPITRAHHLGVPLLNQRLDLLVWICF